MRPRFKVFETDPPPDVTNRETVWRWKIIDTERAFVICVSQIWFTSRKKATDHAFMVMKSIQTKSVKIVYEPK